MNTEKLHPDLAKKIAAFPESGMLFWRVTVILNDGSEIKDVLCEHDGSKYTFLTAAGNINSERISDVLWEGQGRPQWIKSLR
jgi:hypothetical protein